MCSLAHNTALPTRCHGGQRRLTVNEAVILRIQLWVPGSNSLLYIWHNMRKMFVLTYRPVWSNKTSCKYNWTRFKEHTYFHIWTIPTSAVNWAGIQTRGERAMFELRHRKGVTDLKSLHSRENRFWNYVIRWLALKVVTVFWFCLHSAFTADCHVPKQWNKELRNEFNKG